MSIINHIGLSSGKDSTALLGWVINDSGYDLDSIRCSFADTENEYDEVYDQISKLNEYCLNHGVRPIRVLRSEGFLNLAIRKKRFPSSQARFCTVDLKIKPMIHYFEELWLDGHEIISHSGVRADESTERGLLEEWGYSDLTQGKVRRPLLKWTIKDVWAAHKRYKLPVNALYATGRGRVGCRLCCMSNKNDVRITAKTKPWVIDVYRDWEKKVSEARGGLSATFFQHGHIPQSQHSGTYVSKRQKKTFSTCTIDDVVRWSKTLRGGVQGGFDFMFEEDDSHSPCKMGYCE